MAISAVAGLATAIGAAAAAGGITGALVFFGLKGWAAFAAWAALGAGLSMVSRALAPKPNLGAQLRGITQTTREPAGSRKLVYGKMRVGGQVVFISHSGDDNKYLHMAIAFASHEIESFEEIWFNDKKVWTTAGFQSDWGTYVTIDRKLGTATQTASTQLKNANVLWTDNHKLSGIAYVAFKLEWNQDKFPQGVPNITAVIKGKKVYDPRDSNQSATDASTWTYSTNPALCLRDYLVDQKYGLGEDRTLIDSTALTAAANLCEETQNSGVDIYSTSGQKRYQLNGVIDAANNVKDNIEQMLSAMGGNLTYSGGKYFIKGAEYVAPTVTFDEADCVSEITVQTKQSRRGIYNGVKGIFVAENKNWKVLDYPAQISSTYEAEDGDPIYLDMPLPFVTNEKQAQLLAKLALLRSRQQTVLQVTVNLKGLQVKVGDTVNITNTRLGYSSKVFEVIEYSLSAPENGPVGVDLTLIETGSAVYDWTTSDEQDFLSGGELDLYDGRTVDNVTSLSHSVTGLKGPDGKNITTVDFTWTAPTDAFVEFYVVTLEKDDDGNVFEYQTREPRLRVPNLDIGSAYEVIVKAQNLIGVRSSGTTLNIASLAGDTTPPSKPTNFTATGGVRQITVQWDDPTDEDFALTRIFIADTDSIPATSSKTRGSEFVYTLSSSETGAVTKYFWLKSEDYSGNVSAATNSFTGTSVVAVNTDIGTGAVGSDQIDTGAVNTEEIADNAVDITKIADTLQSTNYVANTSGWKLTTDGTFEAGNGTFRGAVTATSITLDGTTITESQLESGVQTSLGLADTATQNDTAFAAKIAWGYDEDAQGWTSNQMTVTHVDEGYMNLASTGNDPMWILNNQSIDGAKDHIVRVRIKRTAGSSWQGTLYYGTSGHNDSESYRKTISDTTVTNEWVVLEYDMSNLSEGGTDWVDNTITRLRFDWGNSSSDTFQVDWIAIGTKGAAPVREGGDVISGTIGGTTITGSKLYQGGGTFEASDTGFYLDDAGQFSLKDKLSFDGTTLNVEGAIAGGSLQANTTTPIPTNVFTRSSNQNIPTGDESGAFMDLASGSFLFGDADSFVSFAENSDATAFELDIKGVLAPTTLDLSAVTDTTVMPSNIKAQGYVDASIGVDAISDAVWNEIDSRVGQGSGGFYTSATGNYLGAASQYITIGTTQDHGTEDITVKVVVSDTFAYPRNFYAGADQLKIKLTLQYKVASGSTWVTAGSTQTRTLTPTLLQYATRYTIDESYSVTLTSGAGNDIADDTDLDFRVKLERVGSQSAFADYNNGGANDTTGTPVVLEVSENASGVAATGGNADTLDNLDSSQFLRSDVDDTFDANLTITGNLTVQGTQTTLETATLQVQDKNIVLNYGTGDTSGSANGAGITIQDAVNSTTDATLLWNGAIDRWDLSHSLVASGNLEATGYLQHFSYLYSRNDLRVLNAAGTGWSTWASRSNGQFNLSVGTISSGAISSGAITSSGSISTSSGSVSATGAIGNLVAGSQGQQLEKGDDAVTTLRFDANRWRLYAGVNAGEMITAHESGQVSLNNSSTFTTGGTARLSIKDSSVLIGMGQTNADMSYIRRESAGDYTWQTYNSGNTGEIRLQPYGGAVAIRTTTPDADASLHVAGPSTGPNLSASTPSNYSMIVSNSDTAYGTLFATLGSGVGEIQQRRTNTASYYDLQLQPHGGNVGIGAGSSAPVQKLMVKGGIYAWTGNIYLDSGKKYIWGNSAQWITATNNSTMAFGVNNATRLSLDPTVTTITHQQNGESQLRLYNNRQDLGNVPVFSVVGYNSTQVAKMVFYRGGGGASGFIRFQNKPTNAASLTDVFQIGDGGTVGYGVDILAGGLRVGGITTIDASRNLTNVASIATGTYKDSTDTFLFRYGTGSGATRHLNLWNSTSDPSNADGNGISGISWGQRSDNQAYYLIYVDKENYGGYNYSRLRLNWHTGIQIGASQSYGGIRFYNDSRRGSGGGVLVTSIGDGDRRIRNYEGGLNIYAHGNNTAGGQIQLGIDTHNATKWHAITGRQYDTSTESEGYSLLTGSVAASQNNVVIGGGLDEQNAATQVQIKAAANVSTRNGTEVVRVTTDGFDVRNNNIRITGTTVINSSRNITIAQKINNSLGNLLDHDGTNNYIKGGNGGSNILYTEASSIYTNSDIIVGNNASKAVRVRHVDGKSATTNAVDDLYLQYGRQKDIRMFESSGTNRKLYIYGNDNGTDRHGNLFVASDGSFNITASDTYLILNAASYIQSQKPHNFTSSLLTAGTTWLDVNRNATFASITSNGQLSLSGNNLAVFGPNSGWSASLAIGGNANNSTSTTASIGATNGNLHIDAAAGAFGTYLNFYDGTGGVYIGSGASTTAAHFNTSGHLNLAGSGVSQSGYALSVASTGVLDTSRNLANIASFSLSGNQTFGANSTANRFDIVVGNQTTSRGFLFAPYSTIGTRYSGWDTWIGTNASTQVGTNSSGIKQVTGYTGSGASILNIGFYGLHYYTWSASELSGNGANTALTLGTAKFSITGAGDLQVGQVTVITAARALQSVNISRLTTDNFSPYLSPTNTNTLNAGYGNNSDAADMWINYRGYQDGFTKFRDFRIGDGKGSALLFVDGSTKSIQLQSSAYLDTNADLRFAVNSTEKMRLTSDAVQLRSGNTGATARFDITSNEGRLVLSNGANWGLIMRGITNSPRIGAWTGGTIAFWAANDSQLNSVDTTKGESGEMFTIDNANDKLISRTDFHVEYGKLVVKSSSNGFAKIEGTDANHMIIMRGNRDSTTTGTDMTTYYQYGGTQASGKGHLFYTGGVLASQTLKLGIHNDAIVAHQPLYANAVNNTYNFKAYGQDTDSWFGVYDDANNSANIILTRSDGATIFRVLGHTGATTIAGTVTTENITIGSSNSYQVNGTNMLDSSGARNLRSTTASFSNSLSSWNSLNDTTNNPANSWWYGMRISHGDAMSYYSATIAINFFSDEVQLRRISGGSSNGWRKFALQGLLATFSEVRSTGNVTAYYSDERLKDFHGRIDSPIDKIKAIGGYYFTENETAKALGYDNDARQVGVNAQEVQRVMPEVIDIAPISHQDDVEEEYLTVHYDKMVPLLIEAIKEQQDQIDELKNIIKEMKDGNHKDD